MEESEVSAKITEHWKHDGGNWKNKEKTVKQILERPKKEIELLAQKNEKKCPYGCHKQTFKKNKGVFNEKSELPNRKIFEDIGITNKNRAKKVQHLKNIG